MQDIYYGYDYDYSERTELVRKSAEYMMYVALDKTKQKTDIVEFSGRIVDIFGEIGYTINIRHITKRL